MLSIIVPAYKERDNLALLVPQISDVLGKSGYEIIIVDDNSQDGTEELISKLSAQNPAIKLLKRKSKLGLASAILDGAAFSKGENILVIDADLSHPPGKVKELSDALGEYDLVVGSRNLPGGGVANWPFHRKMVSKGAELLARFLLGIKISDPMSGFFAVKREVFNRARFRIKGYKILLNIMADNPKTKIREIPYLFKDRFSGKTKLGAGEFIQYVLDVWRIRFG